MLQFLNRMEPKIEKGKKTPRRESLIFNIWVHTGYAVLILSMIAWMVILEFGL